MFLVLLCLWLVLQNSENAWAQAVRVNDSPRDVVIIGGGMAGLSAAFFLTEKGIQNLMVLEKQTTPGGRLSEAYYIGKPENALSLIVKALQLKPLEIPEPMDAAYYDGRFWWGEDGRALMRIRHSSQIAYDAFITKVQQIYRKNEKIDVPLDPATGLAPLDKITAAQWFKESGFSGIYHREYNVAARGLFGANLGEISALSLIPELGFDFEGDKPGINTKVDESDNTLRASRKGKSRSYSFVHGLARVGTALAAHVGDKLHLGSTVTSVTRAGRQFSVAYQNSSDGTVHQVDCRVVILAVPAPVALKIASEILTTEQKAIMSQISYAPFVNVELSSSVPIYDKTMDLALLDGQFFSYIHNPNWLAEHVEKPFKGPHLIRLEVPAASYRDQTLLTLPDKTIIKNCLADLNRIFPGAGKHITETKVERIPLAYPVMTVGAYERLTRLFQTNVGRLLLAGDYTTYPTSEAAADSGRHAATRAAIVLSRRE